MSPFQPYLDDYRKHAEAFEGRCSWMYLDTKGNVTVGIGHLIISLEAAMKLPFVGGDIAADWKAVKTATPGMTAIHYEAFTACRLTDESIDALFLADAAREMNSFSEIEPRVAGLPFVVQEAILDMTFNLGAARLHDQYFDPARKRRFGPAVLRGDWHTAALESAREDIQASRNEWAAKMILSAPVWTPPADMVNA